ncbi:YhaN family protein [Desulfonatronospira sp.]|uniref:YhaN family protein n=1 Tax=Desulfonatronospira sp. TaxID=1962951 RepID=UPI0025C18FC6|nr:YhaN family protein [Desulfonatronospira sp.]
MKISTLNLKAYGHFSNKELHLDQGGTLHLIYGSNEAGKSTALRALATLFYGFDHQSVDGFLHPGKDLAVGACLELDNGNTWEITRYKKRSKDLIDGSGNPVSREAMARLMSGMSREMFSGMFGISHDNLRTGGKEILQAEGHLGQALFSAAAGIMHLRRVQKDLQRRAGELFRPRASSTSIMKKKNSLSQLSKELRQASIKPERWRNLQNELDLKRRQKKQTELRLKELQETLGWYSSCIKALPRIARRRDLLLQLSELESVPLLDQEFSRRRVKAASHLENARLELDTWQEEIKEQDRELAEMLVNTDLLSFEPRIKTLLGRVALVQQASQELQDLATEEITLEQSIREKKALLGNRLSCSDVERLAPGRKHQNRIQELVNEKNTLHQKSLDARATMQEQALVLRRARRDLKKIPPIPDIQDLELASRNLAPARDLQEKIRKSREKIQELQHQVSSSTAALGLGHVDPAELPRLPLPLPQSLERMQNLLRTKEQALDSCRKKYQDLQQYLQEKQEELKDLQKEHSMPLPQDLLSHRASRDLGWQLVKKIWLQGIRDPQEIQNYLEKYGEKDLASGFEKNMSVLDQTTDLMLDRAHHLARLNALQKEIQEVGRRLEQAGRELNLLLEEYDQAGLEWKALWSGTGIEPLSPGEMQAWLYKVQELIRLVRDMQERQKELEQAGREYQELIKQGIMTVESVGHPSPQGLDPAGLGRVLDKIRQRAGNDLSSADLLKNNIRTAENNLHKASQQAADIRENLDLWHEKWASVLQPLGLDPNSDPGNVQEEIQLRQELFTACSRIETLQQRKSGLLQKTGDFNTAVQELTCKLGRDPGQTPALEVLAALSRELEQEQAKLSRQKHLQQERRKASKKAGQAQTKIKSLQQELNQLCREAGAFAMAELPGLEEKAGIKQELRKELKQLEEQLQELAGGMDLEKFILDASAWDTHKLQSLSRELDREKEQLEQQREETISNRAALEKDLQELDGTSRAADIRQEMQEQTSELEQEMQEYIQLRLSAAILASEMERFRQANQGPVLDMAGNILREITLNSLDGIFADYDQRGEPVLKALRPDGSSLGVNEMSDGTRDQLFLALRLGGIKHYLRENPPFPFIVDDILVHFDDDRSERTLQELALLASQTQVLFFTHHHHLLHMARNTLDPDTLCIHHL